MPKGQILVVEDQPATSDLIMEVLKDEGFEVKVVDTLGKARTDIKRELPELLILDRNLPADDGLELSRELREEEKTATIPVLFLTAKKAVEDRVSGLKTGADDYLTK